MQKENSVLVHIRLPETLVKKIDDEARQKYSNRSEVARQILLKQYSNKET